MNDDVLIVLTNGDEKNDETDETNGDEKNDETDETNDVWNVLTNGDDRPFAACYV